MKKLKIYFVFFMCLFMLILTSTVVIALSWATFPATDAADDVYYYPEGGDKSKGDYNDFMDILNVTISDNDIVVKFQTGDPINRSTTLGYGGFGFVLKFDIDNEIFEDYYIEYFDNIIGYYFSKWNKSQEIMGGFTWDGNNWVGGPIESLPFSDINDTLTLQTVAIALSQDGHTLADAKFWIQSQYYRGYITLELEYVDYLPDPRAAKGIPGFQTIIISFSIIAMISLISINKLKKK